MDDLLGGIGIALIILALAISFKGCADINKPMIGINGSIIVTK